MPLTHKSNSIRPYKPIPQDYDKMVKIIGNFKDVRSFIPQSSIIGNMLYLYAITFDNKTLKVGKSYNPNSRLSDHFLLAKQYGKNKNSDVIVFGPYPKDRNREAELIKSIDKVYKNIGGEWFEFDGQIDDLIKFFPES